MGCTLTALLIVQGKGQKDQLSHLPFSRITVSSQFSRCISQFSWYIFSVQVAGASVLTSVTFSYKNSTCGTSTTLEDTGNFDAEGFKTSGECAIACFKYLTCVCEGVCERCVCVCVYVCVYVCVMQLECESRVSNRFRQGAPSMMAGYTK